jgi:hypothetical protein
MTRSRELQGSLVLNLLILLTGALALMLAQAVQLVGTIR